jgi:pyruvyl transferase EpsO
VDYPNYLNPGDAAIWLGARSALGFVNGNPPAYSASLKEFSVAACRARVGTGAIYFVGGGNFGDLYPRHHLTRLKIINSMPDNPIVLLPFSCAWSKAVDKDILVQTRRTVARPGPIRLFTRERKSQSQMIDLFGLGSTLCPDLVHALDIVGPPASIEVQAVLRGDREAATSFAAIRSIDWAEHADLRRWNRVGKLLLMGAPTYASLSLRDWIASRKTETAIRLVSQGKRLITDRLHAFLFGLALGRPVTVLDNSTGKVFAYYDTWSEHLTGVTKGGHIEDASIYESL